MSDSNLKKKIERFRSSDSKVQRSEKPAAAPSAKELLEDGDKILNSIRKSHRPGLFTVLKNITERAE